MSRKPNRKEEDLNSRFSNLKDNAVRSVRRDAASEDVHTSSLDLNPDQRDDGPADGDGKRNDGQQGRHRHLLQPGHPDGARSSSSTIDLSSSSSDKTDEFLVAFAAKLPSEVRRKIARGGQAYVQQLMRDRASTMTDTSTGHDLNFAVRFGESLEAAEIALGVLLGMGDQHSSEYQLAPGAARPVAQREALSTPRSESATSTVPARHVANRHAPSFKGTKAIAGVRSPPQDDNG